ncbi:MAG: hypothetical protein JWP81_2784 [Ferruginibacter sp.]|nr:hypothetical protein [Ferruginibacter sp.]
MLTCLQCGTKLLNYFAHHLFYENTNSHCYLKALLDTLAYNTISPKAVVVSPHQQPSLAVNTNNNGLATNARIFTGVLLKAVVVSPDQQPSLAANTNNNGLATNARIFTGVLLKAVVVSPDQQPSLAAIQTTMDWPRMHEYS